MEGKFRESTFFFLSYPVWFYQSRLTKWKCVALSEAKGLYDGKETLTALACSASVGRDDHAPSHRPDALSGERQKCTLVKSCRIQFRVHAKVVR